MSSVESWQYCPNNWFYFVGCTWKLVFQVFHSLRSILYSCLLIHSLFSIRKIFTKISSFIKRGISFQTLGCVFVTELCVALWKPLLCCVYLACCHTSVDRGSKVLWETWVQLCTFEVLSLFLLQCSVFQTKKPTLGANHCHLSAQ